MRDIYLEGIRSRPICIVAVLLVLVILALTPAWDKLERNNYSAIKPDNVLLDNGIMEGDNITLCGQVEDVVLKNGKKIVDIKRVYLNECDRSVTGVGELVQVELGAETDVRQGQTILVEGEMSYFASATNWGEFDSYAYYRNRGILFKIDDATLVNCGENYNIIRYGLWCLKENIGEQIYRIFGDEDGAILNAMLLGIKNEVPKKIKEAFQKSGISHILAISGLHISFLCMLVLKMCSLFRMRRTMSFIVSETFLVIYILMVGFSASAIRAAIMFSLYLISVLLKRSYDLMTSLAIGLIVITSFNFRTVYDSAFQLSFLAIIGIGFFWKNILNNSNILKRILKMRDKTRICGRFYNWTVVKLGGSMMVTLCISAITLPVLLYCYYEYALYSVLLNLLIVPLMPVLLVSAIAGIVLTGRVDVMGRIFVDLAKLILVIYKSSCMYMEKSGFGRINIGKPHLWQIVIYYTLLALFCLCKGKKGVYTKAFCGLGCLVIITLQNSKGLYFLDVGQGDCVVYIDENRKTYIFDGGSTSRRKIGENVIIPFLKSNGVNKIEAVFVSHPDEDHMNGIFTLLDKGRYENIDVKYLCINGNLAKDDAFCDLINMAEKNNIPVCNFNAGDEICDGDMSIKCMYPALSDNNGVGDDRNNSSLVLRLDTCNYGGLSTGAGNPGGLSVLETGDLETEGENVILSKKREEIQCQILKVAHHGSSSSSSQAFVEAVKPQIAIISAGRNNRYGHPHKETIETLKKNNITIISTAEAGAIRIKENSNGAEVYCYIE